VFSASKIFLEKERKNCPYGALFDLEMKLSSGANSIEIFTWQGLLEASLSDPE
jgi:hypothetical protein